MSFAGAAALAPNASASDCAHEWGLDMNCLRCRLVYRDRAHYWMRMGVDLPWSPHLLLQETGQLIRSYDDLGVRGTVAAYTRAFVDREIVECCRRRVADPVALPGPLRVVLSTLPYLLGAWAMIWIRWTLPPKEDI